MRLQGLKHVTYRNAKRSGFFAVEVDTEFGHIRTEELSEFSLFWRRRACGGRNWFAVVVLENLARGTLYPLANAMDNLGG